MSEFRDLVKEVVRSACRTALLEAGFTPDDYYMADDGANSPGLGQYNDLNVSCFFWHSMVDTAKSFITIDNKNTKRQLQQYYLQIFNVNKWHLIKLIMKIALQ